MTATYTWDACLLRPQATAGPFLMALNTMGGRTLVGGQQVVGNDAGYQRIEYIGIRVRTDAQIRAWNRLQFGLLGRARTINVPVLDDARAPTVTATCEVAVASYATALQLRIHGATSSTITNGNGFSVAERYYRIVSISAPTVSGSDLLYDTIILPRVREPIAAGATLTFKGAAFRCRLESNDAMAGLQLGFYKFGNGPSVAFVEDV